MKFSGFWIIFFLRNPYHDIQYTMKARSHILLRYGSELCGDNFTNSKPAVFKDSPSKFALPG